MAKVKSLKSASLRELNFLCAFILSEKFCALFYKCFRPQYFENPDYKTLVAYIQNYFEKYSKPPKKLIVSYMEKYKAKFRDETLYQSLKKTLITSAESMDELLDKYESQYIIDDAELFIKAAAIKSSYNDIQLALDNDDEENALRVYQNILIPEVQKSSIITFEDDLDKQREVLNKNNNLVIHFKDEVGQLVGPLYRGDFFSWVAPTGTGKSWWLMWTAKQCRQKGLNVLFLSLEMQEQSVLRRFQQMYYKRVLYGDEHGEEVRVARFIKDGDKYKIVHKKLQAQKLVAEDISMLRAKVMGKFPRGRLKIMCRSGINIGDLKAILSELKYQGRFIPDVIVLDYADKMTTARKTSDYRDSLGIIWKDLRDLALDRNILLVTASQTNRAAWDKHFTRDSIAEDSRKLNEVSGAIGIMSNRKDRELGLLMLRLLKTRDGWFENRDVYCSASFNIGQPVIQSVWANKLILPDEIEQSNDEAAGQSRRGINRRRKIGMRRRKEND